eukprot:14854638-Alexandrium_andersonii.AAC.1
MIKLVTAEFALSASVPWEGSIPTSRPANANWRSSRVLTARVTFGQETCHSAALLLCPGLRVVGRA